MNGVVSTCGNKMREKKLGVRNALVKESQIIIMLPKDGQTTKKKYACKTLLVRKCRLHPLIHTLLEFNLAQDVEQKMEPM
jgi:hypothetical protein